MNHLVNQRPIYLRSLSQLVVMLLSLGLFNMAWCETKPKAPPSPRMLAGKRIVSTPKTEAGLGFKPYPGAMLQLNDSVDDCSDEAGDKTTFIFSTADGISKVRTFYGMAPKDAKLGSLEEGRLLQIAGNESGTRITIRHFPPKAAQPAKPAKPARK